jgi:hypothetical protein
MKAKSSVQLPGLISGLDAAVCARLDCMSPQKAWEPGELGGTAAYEPLDLSKLLKNTVFRKYFTERLALQ